MEGHRGQNERGCAGNNITSECTGAVNRLVFCKKGLPEFILLCTLVNTPFDSITN